MNCYLIRYIVIMFSAILSIIVLRTFNILFSKNKLYVKINFILIKIIICFCIIMQLIPIEYSFIKFKTIDKIFNFYEPNSNIIKKYEYEDYAYVIHKQDSRIKISYYIKKDNYWMLDNIFMKEYSSTSIINKKFAKFYLYNNSDTDKMVMIIKYYTKGDNSSSFPPIVSDSLLSDFKTVEYNRLHNKKYYSSITILDDKILDDYSYTVTINNIEFKPFD